jgi:hypothetical protein
MSNALTELLSSTAFVAVVNIYGVGDDFTKKLACYETLNKGALASAKREMEKMEAQRLAA